MLTQIITAIKDITGPRFYFLVTLLFLGFMLITFKDQLKQIEFKPENLQSISNEKDLVTALDDIKRNTPLMRGYIFFIYQPKHDSYYKRMVHSDISFVNSNDYFKAMPLNAQKYLNYTLIGKEYTLLSFDNPLEAEYTNMYNADYVLVYNVYVKETIAEVVMTFDIKPSPAEIDLLIRKLRPIKYYVI